VLTQFAEIDHELSRQAAPEGDVRDEEAEILAEVESARQRWLEGQPNGFEFGIPALDDLIGGLQPGELDLILAFASVGKTSFLINLGWNIAVNQGKNVVLATTETLRPQVRRKLVCRHSKLPIFGLPEGIDSHHLKHPHLLTPAEARALPDVVADLTRNPAYGHFHIMQVPRGGTMAEVESRLLRVHRQWPVDFLGVDSFQLLRAARYRTSTREELASILLEGKELAVTFDDGRGVCVVSPWQVNRDGRDRASRAGHYDLLSLSETSEAERSADVIVSLLEQADTSTRYVDLLGQVLKDRDGPRTGSGTLDIRADYATSSFTSRNRHDAFSGFTSTDAHSVDAHALLMGR
jgi:replicative DNA helicase